MTYNSKVTKARESIGMGIENMPQPVQQYHTDRHRQHEAIKLLRLQYAYSRFLDKGTMTRKQFKSLSNYTENMSKDILIELERMGLIKSTILYLENGAKLYSIVDDKFIPQGWPAKGELLNMESPYRDYVYKPKSTPTEQDMTEASDNPLTKMLSNKDLHVDDTSSYEQLIKDTSRFYGVEELDTLIGAIHEICKRRVEQRYVECPLCRGRIQRNKARIHCTNCGLELNGGTFENSMRMAMLIGKSGVRVQ